MSKRTSLSQKRIWKKSGRKSYGMDPCLNMSFESGGISTPFKDLSWKRQYMSDRGMMGAFVEEWSEVTGGKSGGWGWYGWCGRSEDGRSRGECGESGGGLATTFTDTQKNRDSEIAFSAILDLGNINYSLEFFCPHLQNSFPVPVHSPHQWWLPWHQPGFW